MLRPAQFYDMVRTTFTAEIAQHSLQSVVDTTQATVITYPTFDDCLWAATRVFTPKVLEV
jgi:hypothetical protein